MVKKSCATYSNVVKKNALKVNSKSGVNKDKEFKNAIRKALRIVHNEGSSSNGKSGFKMRRPRSKVNNISKMMSRCSVKPKPKPACPQKKSTFDGILNSMKRNRARRNAIANAARMRNAIKKMNQLHH